MPNLHNSKAVEKHALRSVTGSILYGMLQKQQGVILGKTEYVLNITGVDYIVTCIDQDIYIRVKNPVYDLVHQVETRYEKQSCTLTIDGKTILRISGDRDHIQEVADYYSKKYDIFQI